MKIEGEKVCNLNIAYITNSNTYKLLSNGINDVDCNDKLSFD